MEFLGDERGIHRDDTSAEDVVIHAGGAMPAAVPLSAGMTATLVAVPAVRTWRERDAGLEGDRSEPLWRAVVGFTLRPQPGHDGGLLDIALQQEVISFLMATPALADRDGAVQLRVLVEPGEAQQSVLTLALLGACSGNSRGQAKRRALTFARSLAFVTDFLGGAYIAEPVRDAARLRALLLPFVPRALIEISRAREQLPGIQGTFAVPAPLSRHVNLDRWLTHALVTTSRHLRMPVLWSVTLEGAPDTATLRRHMLDMLAKAQAAQAWALAAEAAEGAVAVAAHLRRNGIAEPALRRLQRLWQTTSGTTGRVQAFLAVPAAGVPDELVSTALAECSVAGSDGEGEPAVAMPLSRPQELRHGVYALQTLRCLPWEAVSAAALQGVTDTAGPVLHPLTLAAAPAAEAYRLTRLVDVDQAAQLLRIPVPAAGGLPGLPVGRAVREVWSPATFTGADLVLGDNIEGRRRQAAGLSLDDRRRHLYVAGQTGTGKSTLLLNAILQDLEHGMGVAVIDPHGDLIDDVLARMPRQRLDDVIVLDPSDQERPVGFNFLACRSYDEGGRIVEDFIEGLRKMYDPHHTGMVGPRFYHAARNAMLTVISAGGTLVEVVRLMTDPAFVQELLPAVTDPVVRRYWTDQIANTSDFHRSETMDYFVSKFSPFVHNHLMRNIVGQQRSTIDLRRVMDEGKVLLVNLAQGHLGQGLSSLWGMVVVPRILSAAFSRVDIPERDRRDFCLYVDEFQNYATPAFVDIVSGARKYRLNITMAHQHAGQLPADVRRGIFGNVGSLVVFRTGVDDAGVLASAQYPSAFTPADLLELPNFRAVVSLLHGGQRLPALSLATRPAPDIGAPSLEWARTVREHSRHRYGRDRCDVETEIEQRAHLKQEDGSPLGRLRRR